MSDHTWDGPTDSDGKPCYWVNHYHCEACDCSWEDQWSCQCDDECPSCGDAYTPTESDWLGPDMSDPTLEQMREFLRGPARDLEADSFDVEAAIYWFASDYHGGQGSNLYSALCISEFRPGLCHSGVEDSGDVATMLYQELEGALLYGSAALCLSRVARGA